MTFQPFTPVPDAQASPARRAFKHNIERLQSFTDLSTQALRRLISEAQTRQVHAGQLERIVKDLDFLDQWSAVMLVTFTEAYLHDALVYFAARDATLINDSQQAATYPELLEARSLEDILQYLRSRWARNWIDRSGPSGFIERFERMGARGFPPDSATKLDQLWGVRHVVVHRAGIATHDLVKRHPELGFAAGDLVSVSPEQVLTWASAVIPFVAVCDSFLVTRCGLDPPAPSTGAV